MKALIERIKKSNEFLNALTSHNILDAEAIDSVRRCVIRNELAIADYEKIVNGASKSDEALPIDRVVGRSEQLVCDKCGYPMFYHKPDDIMYCHGCNNTKSAN